MRRALTAHARALRVAVADYEGWRFDPVHGGWASRVVPGESHSSWPLMVFVHWDHEDMAYAVEYKGEYGINESVGTHTDANAAMRMADERYKELIKGSNA